MTINLNGESKFLVNNVDVLKSLQPQKSNAAVDNLLVESLADDFKNLKLFVEQMLQTETPTNSSTLNETERSAIASLRAEVKVLKLEIENLNKQLSIDRCRINPCQNGGSCFNLFNSFRCECTESFEGPTCDLDVDECKKFAGTELGCQNGAVCNNLHGSYE